MTGDGVTTRRLAKAQVGVAMGSAAPTWPRGRQRGAGRRQALSRWSRESLGRDTTARICRRRSLCWRAVAIVGLV